MSVLGWTGPTFRTIGGRILVCLLVGVLGPGRAMAEVRAPAGGALHGSAGTPLHDLPVSKANKVLLPLFGKWVALVLRSGETTEGRLADIRVRYVVLRDAAGKSHRVLRRNIVQVRPATRRMAGVTAAALEALKGRTVRLLKRDGTHLDGVVGTVTETEVNLETSSGVVGVPIAGLKQVLLAKAPPKPATTAEKLAGFKGRTVRLYLNGGARVQGVLRDASESEVRIETSTETVTIQVANIKRFLVAAPARPAAAGATGADAAGEGGAPGVFRAPAGEADGAPARAVLPHHYGGKGLADQAFRERLLAKYVRIKDNGARLRNWGIGLMVASVVLEVVGSAILMSSKTDAGRVTGIAMDSIGGALFLPGLIMMAWGQVRHVRGIDMENTIQLTRR